MFLLAASRPVFYARCARPGQIRPRKNRYVTRSSVRSSYDLRVARSNFGPYGDREKTADGLERAPKESDFGKRQIQSSHFFARFAQRSETAPDFILLELPQAWLKLTGRKQIPAIRCLSYWQSLLLLNVSSTLSSLLVADGARCPDPTGGITKLPIRLFA